MSKKRVVRRAYQHRGSTMKVRTTLRNVLATSAVVAVVARPASPAFAVEEGCVGAVNGSAVGRLTDGGAVDRTDAALFDGEGRRRRTRHDGDDGRGGENVAEGGPDLHRAAPVLIRASDDALLGHHRIPSPSVREVRT